MLLKVMKHDLINSFKNYALLYVAMLVVGIAGPFIISLEIEMLNFIIFALISVLFVGSSVAVIFNTVIFIKNQLFSEVAYLNYTLPVKMSTSLLSKVIVSIFWVVITILVASISLFSFLAIFVQQEVININELLILFDRLDINWVIIAQVVLWIIAALSTTVMLIILSLTIVNTSMLKTSSRFIAFAIYLGLLFALNGLDTLFLQLIGMENLVNDLAITQVASTFTLSVIQTNLLALTVYQLGVSVILFTITNYLLNRKLEL